MESTPNMEAPKSNKNLIIIGVVVVVVLFLCCCCLTLGLGGYFGYKAYAAGQQALDEFNNVEIPTTVPFDPGSPDVQVPSGVGVDVPQGGLTDEETRYRAWAAIEIMGSVSGCSSPTVDGTTIKVVQQPDSSGAWNEEWNVNCGGGSYSAVLVKFKPESDYVSVDVNFP